MSEDVGTKIGAVARRFIPFFTTLLFLLLSVFVWPIPFWGSIAPSLGLIAVYYWSIYRPDLFTPLAVFCLGLLSDALHLLPVGLSACIFLLVYQLARSQRRFFAGQVFFMLWTGFAITACLAVFSTWAILSIYDGQLVPLLPVAAQYALTVAIYPLVAWFLIRIQRSFLTVEG